MNRVYQAIISLQCGPHSAWAGASAWVDNTAGMRMALFLLVFLLSGCDFLPRFDGLLFLAMWKALVKGLRVEGLFPKPLLRRDGRLLIVDKYEVVKFLAVAFYYQKESAFSTKETSAETILEKQGGGG